MLAFYNNSDLLSPENDRQKWENAVRRVFGHFPELDDITRAYTSERTGIHHAFTTATLASINLIIGTPAPVRAFLPAVAPVDVFANHKEKLQDQMDIKEARSSKITRS